MNKVTKYYVCGFEIPKGFYDSYRVPKIEACIDYAEDTSNDKFEYDFIKASRHAKVALRDNIHTD